VKKILIAIVLLFSCSLLPGQEKGIVQGRVLDSASKRPLETATITASRLADSSRIGTGVCNANGWFHVNDIPLHDSVVIEISYIGYSSFRGLLILNDNHFTMRSVLLHPAAKEMDTIIVKASPPLVVIKKDTIEFDASSFKTPPNAVANDLIKRIPGLTIDEQGRLIYNGRSISKVLVDGKVFFDNDGWVALNNIPVSLIKKVQISFDEAANSVQGAGTDQKAQTLNIRLKEGKKYFGNVKAAGGTDKRYDLSGLVNQTKEKEQIGLLGGWNNINKTGILPPSGAGVTTLTDGGGITRTVMGSVNYNRDLTNETGLHAVYRFTNPVTFKELIQQRRQTVLVDSSLLSSTEQQYRNIGRTHSVNMNVQKKNSLFVTAAVSDITADNISATNTSTTGQRGALLNDLQSTYSSKSRETGWETNVTFVKPVNNKGRQVLLSATYGGQLKSTHDQNNAVTGFYKNNLPDSQAINRQTIEGNIRNDYLTTSLEFTQPVSKCVQWKTTNKLSLLWTDVDKTTWHVDADGNKQRIDSVYSNSFRSTILTNSTVSGLSYKANKWSGDVGVGIQYNSLYNLDRTHATGVRNRQINWVPAIEISTGKNPAMGSLSFKMNVSTVNPAREQLQPVADNTNPLNIKTGNPGLRAAVSYNTSINFYKMFSLRSGSAMSGNVAFVPVSNKIIPFVSYDSLGRQVTRFENVNGTWSLSSTVFGSTRLKSGRDIFMITTMIFFIHDQNRLYLNGLLCGVQTASLAPSLFFRYTRGNSIEAAISYSPFYSKIHYEQNLVQNRSYWIQKINGSLDLYTFGRLKWKHNLSFIYNGSLPGNFDKSSIFWNMELAYLCFKNKNGEISFTAFDLLKQNRNINRTVAENYIEDSQANNLQQYFMVGFTWNFSKLQQSKAVRD
jgi:hypothetical protein